MKVLAISGSPRRSSTTDQLLQAVLSGVQGCEIEFVSLSGKQIGPCIACLGCVSDNVCKVKDDLAALRPKIVEADAYVIGGANYFNTLNSLTHCFMERWYQFRHQEGKAVAGKLGVAVGVGGSSGERAVEDIKEFFQYNQIDCVGAVSAQGAASCFTCGHGETCKVGAIHMFFGPGTKITPEIIPGLSKQPDRIELARALGRKLSERLHKFAVAT
ncbi:MAG: flavodoxin family protein [Sedimentisphaerales bacterium]|nr:flavodoxin family protein [Sedimentisphaerales bacterium]